FQEAPFFTAETAARYAGLAEDAAFVAALGVGLSPEPEHGVRGVALDAAEPLRGEWDVTVLSPHFAAAFVARDLGDGGPARRPRRRRPGAPAAVRLRAHLRPRPGDESGAGDDAPHRRRAGGGRPSEPGLAHQPLEAEEERLQRQLLGDVQLEAAARLLDQLGA